MNWESFGQENPTLGRHGIRAALEAAGLVLNSREYQIAYEAVRRGGNAEEQARAAKRAEQERLRVEPFMAAARGNVMAWGCVEDGGSTPEEIEEMIREEATLLADEAEEQAAEAARAAEREEQELADYLARQAGLRAAVLAAEGAVAAADGWRIEERRCSNECSRYYWLLRGGDPAEADDYEEAASLRISDHHAPNGSGWSDEKQERHEAPDINIVLRRGAGGGYTFDLAPLMETLDR